MNIIAYLAKMLTGKKDESPSAGTSAEKKVQELKDFVSDQYGYYVPNEPTAIETPKYERYEYQAPSDEQLTESAKAELSDYENSNQEAIKDEYENKAKELEANKVSSKALYDQNSEQLKSAYQDAAEKLSNDSLKRGLARSSIAINNQAAANKAYANSINDLTNAYNQKVAAIDEELNGLDGQLQNALNSFKISYAAKLTERINELKAEREKNAQKAIEYNNSIATNEFENEISKQKTQSDLYMEELKQKKLEVELSESLTNEEKERINRNIYDKVVSILESMPFAEARILFLNEPIFRECLNDFYYYTLYYKYK